ncbi:MAG: regulatory protein RecX [Candidatus Peregrinibacteria bacterium]
MTDLDKKIWEKALLFLKFRPHSRKELKTKLAAHFAEATDAIDQTLDEMGRVQLINDRRFTELWVAFIIQKPVGRIKILVEARRKGLDRELVEQALSDAGWDEKKSALRALEEKKRTLHEEDSRKRKMKLANFLRGRGFTNAIIFRIV